MIAKRNKKGIMGIIIFVIFLFLVLFIGVIMALGGGVLNWVFDEAVPELTGLGDDVGGVNMTAVSGYTIAPVNNIVQSFSWLGGVLYVMMLIGVMGLAIVFRGSPNRWLIGFFVLVVLVLIMGSIFMSNIYEEFYSDTGTLGDHLKEQTILSSMILYSPMIFSVIAFISGIILFSGRQEEEFI